MSGTLVLVGGGEFSQGCDFDRELLAQSGASEVVLLATGWAYENPKKAVAQAQSWFQDLGVQCTELPVYTRSDAAVSEYIDKVRQAKFIYLTGVSPMHIKSCLKETPLFDALVSFWKNGGVLAGSNAGADVICDPMVDVRGGAFTVGLGLCPKLSVIARSNTWSPDKVRRTIDLASQDVALVELPERSALVHDSNGWRSIGPVAVHKAGTLCGIDGLPSVP